jgi:hypothetical protein
MAEVQKGYFIITDISGYTIFLTKSELDHAQHIIEALFEAQLASISKPLQISNFQGDAILCFVAEKDVSNKKDLLAQIKKLYQAFSDEMAAMQIDPPCGCTACANVSSLDLKIFLHYGEFILRQFGDRSEILGPDVILAHRMMKNRVREATGITSYLLLSRQAYDRLKIGPEDFKVVPHTETYEHIGAVEMFVGSLVAS